MMTRPSRHAAPVNPELLDLARELTTLRAYGYSQGYAAAQFDDAEVHRLQDCARDLHDEVMGRVQRLMAGAR